MSTQHEAERQDEAPAGEAAPAAAATPEAPAAETPEAAASPELDALKSEVAALKDEVLRSRAEADNVRKRAERDVQAAHKYGLERLAQELLPVKDSLDLGLDAAATATDVEALREGMALTAKMFGDFFTKLDITVVDPAGARFDPEFHQAMTTEQSVEAEPGTVLRVMQKGYLLNDRLLRPALVVVAAEPPKGD
ncbi:MAG: nucleotide exchange factor GrpE [Gammaproteobacteria bacterium]